MRNAFIIEGPVPPELFFDRREILEYFEALLDLEKYRMLIAILAPFKFGKTSLLLKLRSIAEKYKKVIPIVVRLNIIGKPIKYILTKLAERFSGCLDVDQLVRLDEPYFIFEAINQILEKHDKWLLLFVDEFQDLPAAIKSEGFFTDREDSFIFEFIRGLTEEFRIGLVVSGSLIGPLLDAIDVWHGRFTIFRLREFPLEDSIRMLNYFFRLSGLEVRREILEYIAVAMNNHPFHMQLFGYHLTILRQVDEESLEITRQKIQRILAEYYEVKFREAERIDPRAIELLLKTINGVSLSELSDEEVEIATLLEKAGFIFKEDNTYRIYDLMFGRYLQNRVSGRLIERYIPEFASEYLVARKLAYGEGFKEILISMMSWGPFDIVLLKEFGKYKGVGIQVKRTYDWRINLKKNEIETLKNEAKKLNLKPLIAVIKLPEKEIRFYTLDLKTYSPSLKELLKETEEL